MHANKPMYVHLCRYEGTQVHLSLLQSESWNLLIIYIMYQINAVNRLHNNYLIFCFITVTLPFDDVYTVALNKSAFFSPAHDWFVNLLYRNLYNECVSTRIKSSLNSTWSLLLYVGKSHFYVDFFCAIFCFPMHISHGSESSVWGIECGIVNWLELCGSVSK